MMRGRFFCVDKRSLQVEGQVLFRYLPVCKNDGEETAYPAYLTIKPYAVDVFFHGKDKGGKDKDRDNKDEKHIVNTCIMSLPLSMNLAVKDNLSYTLREIYKDEYEINIDQYKIQSVRYTTYRDLDVFGPKQDSEDTISLRTLLLDFLFDMEHSSVFQASPHYEMAEVHLKENFFLSAIAAKAAYYYLRHMYSADLKTNSPESEIYGFQLKDAEVQWLNTIRAPRAGEWMGEERGWFKSVEAEYQQVLFDFNRLQWRQELHKKTRENQNDDNAGGFAAKAPGRKERSFLKRKKKQTAEELETENLQILRESARWFLRRYDTFSGMKTLLQGNSKGRVSLICGGVLAIVFLGLICLNLDALLQQAQLWPSLLVYGLLSVCCLPVGLMVLFRKESLFVAVFGLLLPRLIMATASAWLIFIGTEELWKVSLDRTLTFMDLLPALLLLAPVIIFMAIEIRNIATEISFAQLVPRIGSVLLTGLVYAIIIGVFFIGISSQKMLTRSGYLNDALSVFANDERFTISGELATLIDQQNTPHLPARSPKGERPLKPDKADNCIPLTLSERQIYKGLNDISYDSLGRKIFIKYEIPLWGDKTFDFFPGMLVYRAIFALFIGIFIQLIFEDKPITEPL